MTIPILYQCSILGSHRVATTSVGAITLRVVRQNLSSYLSRFIKERGGEILLGHMVTKILIEDKKAVGIEYVKKGKSTEMQKAYAKVVVANAAVPNVANELLPPEEAQILKDKIKGMRPACSLLSVYFFFKRPAKEFGSKHYSSFFLDSKVQSLKDFKFKVDYKDRGFVFVDYGQIDSRLAPKGKSVGTICTIDYLEDWVMLNDKEYKDRKEVVAHEYIEKLDSLFPGIKDAIDFYEVATPKTIMRYTLNPSGTAYGFAQIPSQAGIKRIQHKSPIPNLYFASSWSMPGGGFTGAILSGYFCAQEILQESK